VFTSGVVHDPYAPSASVFISGVVHATGNTGHRTQNKYKKNPNEAIQNEQTRDTGNIREKTQNEEKKPPKNQTQKTKKR
jgi:hypothetical protein